MINSNWIKVWMRGLIIMKMHYVWCLVIIERIRYIHHLHNPWISSVFEVLKYLTLWWYSLGWPSSESNKSRITVMRNYLASVSKLPQTKEELGLTRQTYLAASRGQTLSGRNEQLKLDQTLASLSDCCWCCYFDQSDDWILSPLTNKSLSPRLILTVSKSN